jgi:glycosyltransferase involved in cell wall biosynthesis
MKVIYFKPNNSTFVLRDQKILENHFDTKTFLINTKSPVGYFFSLLRLIFFLTFFSWQADVFFIRFADWHTAIVAFFKKIYCKKLYIVIGGYDVAAIPQINYGVHIRKGRSRFARYAMKNASFLLPVSENLIEYQNRFISDPPTRGGILSFVPKVKGKIEVIPNGFDGQFWQKIETVEKENLVLTVAYIHNDRTFRMKGMEKFIAMAEKFPDYQFVAVGFSEEYVNKLTIELPQNFKPAPKANTDQLKEYYSRAKVFCLFSLSEGMPNTLCEAMLCECIPVGTDVTSISGIIGTTGFVVKNNQVTDYEKAVSKATESDLNLGKLARNRILTEYSLEKREQSITNLLLNQHN